MMATPIERSRVDIGVRLSCQSRVILQVFGDRAGHAFALAVLAVALAAAAGRIVVFRPLGLGEVFGFFGLGRFGLGFGLGALRRLAFGGHFRHRFGVFRALEERVGFRARW